MDNHHMGWPLLYETPLGMICLYGKVMTNVVGAEISFCCPIEWMICTDVFLPPFHLLLYSTVDFPERTIFLFILSQMKCARDVLT